MQYEKNKLSIKSWAENDRPREKLMHHGKAVLSDAELIAILLGSGSRNESAVELAKRILHSVHHNLDQLGKLSLKELMQFKGMGEAKSITVIAALELGRRRKDTSAAELDKITSSKDVHQLMLPLLQDLQHEEFWVLLLNRNNKVIRKECISKGGVSATIVDVKIVLKKAVDALASGIILCHNHPSGNNKASEEDIRLTKKMKEAALLMDISLLDHVIFAHHQYFSFADEGLL